jgi:hypothetical protein
MPGEDRAKGPASYLPSIEKIHGKPIAHWMAVLDGLVNEPHMQQVAVLKSEHGLGHGHANALVAFHKGRRSS